jgi:hypothetical protein
MHKMQLNLKELCEMYRDNQRDLSNILSTISHIIKHLIDFIY